jgi:hypothetical protein
MEAGLNKMKMGVPHDCGLEANAFEGASGRNAGATKLMKCTFSSESE